MPIIYVTGPAGAGKSTLAIELQRRGIEAYEGDGNFCGWHNLKSGQKVAYPQSQEDRPADWESYQTFDRYAQYGATTIDSNRPIEDIASDILEYATR